MEIKAQDVKALRDKTGAGMMNCKNALVEAEGDFTKAEKTLKELGLAEASKRSGKEAREGRIFSTISNGRGVVLELSCETDFVSKNQDFINLGSSLAAKAVETGARQITDDMKAAVDDVKSRIKENMGLRRFDLLEASENELLVDYIHGEGRIGVLTRLKVSDAGLKDDPRIMQTAFDVALHIAAFAPLFLSRDEVDRGYLAEQEGIYRKQAENLGKPEKIVEGIVKGKVNKHLSEICLMDQGFVKDEKVKTAQVLKDLGKEIEGSVDITGYLYYKVGEEV